MGEVMGVNWIELVDKIPGWILPVAVALTIALFVFSFQLWRYGPAIKKLNEVETITRLAYYAEASKNSAIAIGEATDATRLARKEATEFRNDLAGFRDFIADMQARLSEQNAEAITEARLESLPRSESTRIGSAPNGHDSDAMFRDMMNAWERFADTFRRRLEEANIPVNMKKVGRMIYELVDKRRRNPIAVETADLISALHSQYKRYIRMQSTKTAWLTPDVHANFLQLVQTAVDELQRPPQQTELSMESARSAGNAASPSIFGPTSSAN
jgi:hypothetical protein